ncbi:hypothetical protein FHS51_001718 [Sphingobium wenxiniae]|uniref:Uncharacterized protein n=1 Tax=Sphingobium wenxiniae (strain DSM 21828 / CGMCC 1.7748 / JZ-1) TaxID=595605 RepID=A0A562KCS6_SPHWJ|nr:hypothetical protein [Sphingobium wenxiniae]MBB6191491.1 hypothetical protein [Sphingobium wenxiniae]TWH93218.1 hypothetical protein IQ35_02125 [Sphingobium wenxiniae]
MKSAHHPRQLRPYQREWLEQVDANDSRIPQPYRWHHHVIFIASTLMLLWLALGALPG